MGNRQAVVFGFWDAVNLGFGFGFGFILCVGLFGIGAGIIFGITVALSS